MAFTGTPVVQEVTERLYRITGVSLGDAASGTISFTSGTGEIKLPRSDDLGAYGTPNHGVVSLQDSIQVNMNLANAGPGVAVPIQVAKSGVDKTDFLITLTNRYDVSEEGLASGELEIYVAYH